MLSPGLSSLEMDSNTSMSAPSPASVSMDGTMSSLTPPPQSSKDTSNSALDVRVLQHRVRKTTPPVEKPKYSSFANKLTARVHVICFLFFLIVMSHSSMCTNLKTPFFSINSSAYPMTCHLSSLMVVMELRTLWPITT